MAAEGLRGLSRRNPAQERLRQQYAAVRLSEMPGFKVEGKPTRRARQRVLEAAEACGRPVKVSQAQFVLELDKAQRGVYEKMAHAYRWAYNQGVAYYRTLGVESPDHWTKARGLEVRSHVIELSRKLSWAEKGYLAKLFQYGVEEFNKAADSSWALYKSKLYKGQWTGKRAPKKPVFGYRTKKDWTDRWRFSLPQCSCTLEGDRIYVAKNFVAKHWGITTGAGVGELDRLRASFGPDRHPVADFAICKLIGGKVVLRVARYEQAVQAAGSDSQAAVSGGRTAISLDPGKRTFLTGYMDGVGCGDLDEALNDRLLALRKRLLRLDAILAGKGRLNAKPTGRKRRSKLMGRRALEARISNIVDDAHWKLAHLLCGLADDVVLGKFYVPGIVRGRIDASVKWVLLRQRHCLFRKRLQHVAGQYAGVKVHLQNEAYTSKTCSHCGKLNERLGSSKTFVCPHCGSTFDRDANAARNIMIRWFVEAAAGADHRGSAHAPE